MGGHGIHSFRHAADSIRGGALTGESGIPVQKRDGIILREIHGAEFLPRIEGLNWRNEKLRLRLAGSAAVFIPTIRIHIFPPWSKGPMKL